MEAFSFSSIFESWKFCTFASFIGCIILLFLFNHTQNSLNEASLTKITKSPSTSSSSSSSSSSKLFTKQNVFENAKQIGKSKFESPSPHYEIKEAKTCNIFEGKWVYDPEGSPLYDGAQCPFLSDQVSCQRNGRPDSDYEKWSWEANGCEIPRYNGKETLEKLRGKRVIIVGDSLNRNQWESFACLLYSSLSPSQTHVDEKSGSHKVLKSKEFNCTVEFYWSPFLVQLKVNKENGSRVLKLDKISKYARMWKDADIMVFNTGHWWTRRRNIKRWDFFEYGGKEVENMEIGMAFETAMKTWAKWVSQNVDRNKTRVFFRSISPEHKGEQWCYKKTNLITNESYAWSFPREMVDIVERTIIKNPVISYLNITKLSLNRRDGHPSVYKTKEGKTLIEMGIIKPEKYSDCSHWCLPGLPDTWNRLLFASLILNTPKNVSIS